MEELRDMEREAREDHLKGLPRASLQKLAKEAGQKANAKSADIISSLLEALEAPIATQGVPQDDNADLGGEKGAGDTAVPQGAPAGTAAEESCGGEHSTEGMAQAESVTGTAQRKKRCRNTGSESACKPKTSKKTKPEVERADTVQEAGLPKIPPINPAVSPKKGTGPHEQHPPAPACKTVLLPTLEEAEDLPTGPSLDKLADPSGPGDKDPFGGSPATMTGTKASQDGLKAAAGMQIPSIASPHPLTQGVNPISPGEVVPEAEESRLVAASAPKGLQDTDGPCSGPALPKSAFAPTLPDLGLTADEQDRSGPSDTAPLGPASLTKEAEAREDPSETMAAPAGTAGDVGDEGEEVRGGAEVEAVSPVAVMVPYPSNPLAEKDLGEQAVPEEGCDLSELSQVEALVFGSRAVPCADTLSPPEAVPTLPTTHTSEAPQQAAKTPISAVAAILQDAQDCEVGDPSTTDCTNPLFEDDDASPNAAAASLEGAGGVGSNSEAHVVKTPIPSTLQGLSRMDSMSRSEQDAFERGRKSGLWQGKIEANLGHLEEQWDAFKGSSTRAWQLPSMDEVRAQGQKLAASGFTTVTTPILGNKSREAVQRERQALVDRKMQPSLARQASKTGVRNPGVQKRQSNSLPARPSPLRQPGGPKENSHPVATPSRLSKVSRSVLLDNQTHGGDLENLASGKSATTPGVKGRLKAAQAERAKKAEANFAARRMAALARAKK